MTLDGREPVANPLFCQPTGFVTKRKIASNSTPASNPAVYGQELDNRIIAEITDKLHDSKQNQQLIFASHNANIVVNGSAELVGHLDLKDNGDREFACTGAIDRPEVSNVITSTMEGGEKAFKDRQDKYGY